MRNTRAQQILCGENEKKKKRQTTARKKRFSRGSTDRFYPLQSHDREYISSSAVKRGTAGKLRTPPVQSIFVLRIRRALATVHHRRSNDYGGARTRGVKEKTSGIRNTFANVKQRAGGQPCAYVSAREANRNIPCSLGFRLSKRRCVHRR